LPTPCGWPDDPDAEDPTLAALAPRNVRASSRRQKATFTAGHMIYELARAFVTESACYLGQGQWDLALAACERALQLAAPRGYRLIHAITHSLENSLTHTADSKIIVRPTATDAERVEGRIFIPSCGRAERAP